MEPGEIVKLLEKLKKQEQETYDFYSKSRKPEDIKRMNTSLECIKILDKRIKHFNNIIENQNEQTIKSS